jgi:hypothetical protein
VIKSYIGAGTAQGTVNSVNVRDKTYGAICDGGSHPLSGSYGSLAAAQAVYPFVTSLTQQIDYAALKLASNTALGVDGSEHAASSAQNKPIYIPAGTCNLGSDTWTIRNADGIKIMGDAATATTLTGSSIVLQFDGLWYSAINDLKIVTTSSSATTALDVDGNVPGHAYATRSVQANTFSNLLVDGGASSYAVAMCRQGGSGAQCSENTFVNPHLSNAASAAYYQNGFNAIDNVIVGGDIQNFSKDGIYLLAGSIHVLGTSFESTVGYTQLANGGCDITAKDAGTSNAILFHGSRSEDLCMYHGGASQLAEIRGASQNVAAFLTWAATTAFTSNQLTVFTLGGVQYAYRVTTPGTSGGTMPSGAWSNTITDGSITWTYLTYNAINIGAGWFDWQSSRIDPTASVSMPANFTVGQGTFGSGSSAGINADGSNSVMENCTVAQGYSLCAYANPQGTSQTLASGLTLPASSTGIFGGGGADIIFGYNTTPFFKLAHSTGPLALLPLGLMQATFSSLSGSNPCNSSFKGYELYVTDGTATGWGATITGSGGGVKAICNGTNWVAE